MQPFGTDMGQWQMYPPDSASQYNETLSINGKWDSDDVLLWMTLPVACVVDNSMHKDVTIRGKLQVDKFDNVALDIKNELFTGFPGEKPTIQTEACSGDFNGGGSKCCYKSEDLPPCEGSPYSKACEGLLAAQMTLKHNDDRPDDPNILGWHYVDRTATDPDDGDLNTEFVKLPPVDRLGEDLPAINMSSPMDFQIVADFSMEEYKMFDIGWNRTYECGDIYCTDNLKNDWHIDRPMQIYDRDRNCDHVKRWPQASFDFTVRLRNTHVHQSFSTDSTEPMQAEVSLKALEIKLTPPITYQKAAEEDAGR